MDWFKTTASFWSHPKVADLTDRAFRVLVSSWGYAAQHGTGGRINRTALRMIGGTPSAAKALVDAGLWHPDGDGWVIHEWDDHQAAAAALEERRRRDRDRKKTARRGRGLSADIPTDASAEIPPTEKRREEERREPPLPPSTDTPEEPPRERGRRRGRPTLAEQIARAEELAAAHTVNGRIVYDPMEATRVDQ